MSSSNCCFLTCIQVPKETGKVIWYSHVLNNFPQSLVERLQRSQWSRCFSEILLLSCDPKEVRNLISGFSASSKSNLNIWKFLAHILLKPSLENFEHYFASMWNEYNCIVVLTFFGTALLWDWNEHWPFPVLWPLPRPPYLLAYWVQHFQNVIF